MKQAYQQTLFFIAAMLVICLAIIPATKAIAVGLGLLIGAAITNLFPGYSPSWLSKARKLILNSAVVLFGFGLNIHQVIEIGSKGFWQTAISLAVIVLFGFYIMRFFSLEKKTLQLITLGSAICGGSAIAAVSTVLKPDDKQIGISTGVVFLLNTVALFLFPFLAGILPLSAHQYGLWCALSIHDTSSVVGAAASLGDVSLHTATILKLTRTLWIIPMVFVLSILNGEKGKISVPFFIVFFLAASVAATFLPFPELFKGLASLGKVLMAIALFIVGYGLQAKVIKQVGVSGITFGILVWIVSMVTGYFLAVMG